MTVFSKSKTARSHFELSRSKRRGSKKDITLEAQEFIRRFLLHVLPDGFMRIRHFGFLANRSKKQALAQCRKLLDLDPALPQCSHRLSQRLAA